MSLSLKKADRDFTQAQAIPYEIGSLVVVLDKGGVGRIDAIGEGRFGDHVVDAITVTFRVDEWNNNRQQERVVVLKSAAQKLRPMHDDPRDWSAAFDILCKTAETAKVTNSRISYRRREEMEAILNGGAFMDVVKLMAEIGMGESYQYQSIDAKRLLAIELSAASGHSVKICEDHLQKLALGKRKDGLWIFREDISQTPEQIERARLLAEASEPENDIVEEPPVASVETAMPEAVEEFVPSAPPAACAASIPADKAELSAFFGREEIADVIAQNAGGYDPAMLQHIAAKRMERYAMPLEAASLKECLGEILNDLRAATQPSGLQAPGLK